MNVREVPLILIVESDPSIAQMLARMLRVAGYQTHIAPDAETAMRDLLLMQPCLITLDLNLPGINGPTFLKYLRTSRHMNHLAVILITAQDQIQHDVRSLTEAILIKPFALEELLSVVQAIIAKTNPCISVSPARDESISIYQ